ncbi:penicillin-binding protein 1A [Haliangium sp.]|uniref:penicillin-binding protein 1A n=1 Tax=Haliangium sp. TaxID=2663208 RepID=UPI003D12FEBF
MSSPVRQRVAIANPADGGVIYWLLKLYAFAVLVLCALLAMAAVLVYRYFADQTPPAFDLAEYARSVPGISRIYAADGTVMGEFADEWRELVPYEDIPESLVHAFLAIEDHEFFEHRGLYFRGIARAVWTNLVAGDFAQGGSTITQQVAKQFLGSDKSLTRKAKEAVLARRLEAKYPKEAILSVYLNHIYLGSGAYGVAAAARRYFSKPIDQLDLSEAALIAGLAQAPSRYSPLTHPDRARARRDEVLERMAARGYISADEAERWQAHDIEPKPYQDIFPSRMPYYAEHVRRRVVERHGLDALMRAGLRVETAVEPTVDGAAAENVEFGVRKQDKRQGWRGAEAYLEGGAREVFLTRAAELYGDAPLEEGRRYLGLVEEVTRRRATVRVGTQSYELPLANLRWAARWSRTEAVNDREVESAREVLRPGHVVWVSREPHQRGRFRDWFLKDGANPRWEPPRELTRDDAPVRLVLEQVPHPQGALFTADHETGYVVAMIGGHDFGRSEYNRAVQACRQPGSTYKPIYYSAALDRGYGFDTILNDKPRAEIDPVTGEVWYPTNLGGSVDNQVTLEYSLVFSKNIPSVAIFKMVGASEVEAWARRLGFTSEIIADQALALGASCTYLDELTRAFAIFARNGRWIDWVYVRRILDRDGAVVEDHTVPADPMLAPADRLDRLAATAGDRPQQAIPARTAYLISKLLSQAIEHGFAAIVRATDIKAAGKTGTSSATMDTSFVGFTSRWITTVWLGDDMRVRPLGVNDAAYMTVVPMWSRYMYEAAHDQPLQDIPWQLPEGVNPKDRGDHSRGEHGEPMPLIYHKSVSPEDLLLAPDIPPAG